jgi:hypothetical protein
LVESPGDGPDHWDRAEDRDRAQQRRGVAWRRQFIAPNQLLEARPDGLSILQAVPAAPGRCLLRIFDYTLCISQRQARAARYLAARQRWYSRRSGLAVAESTQKGMIEFGYQAAGSSASAATVWFRQRLAARIPELTLDRPPTDLR